MLQKKIDLFGLFIDDISLEQATELARESLSGGEIRSFFTPNLEILDGARRSEGIKGILNTGSVSLPDGTGLKIVAKLLGKKLENTVAGIDFGEELLALAANGGKKIFLLGGKDGVAEQAAENLRKKYKRLDICGVYHGYFSDDEAEDVCGLINCSQADILIVCRGFPRQEKFVFKSKALLPKIKVFACLGGAIDVWSGNVRRAPRLLRLAHLEWLWRIACDPHRLERFCSSLGVLPAAFCVFAEKLSPLSVMKRVFGAYNRTSNEFEP